MVGPTGSFLPAHLRPASGTSSDSQHHSLFVSASDTPVVCETLFRTPQLPCSHLRRGFVSKGKSHCSNLPTGCDTGAQTPELEFTRRCTCRRLSVDCTPPINVNPPSGPAPAMDIITNGRPSPSPLCTKDEIFGEPP